MAPIRPLRSKPRNRAGIYAAKDLRKNYAPPVNPHDSDVVAFEASGAESQPERLQRNEQTVGDERKSWQLTKRDKRIVKHNILIGKVQDGSIQKRKGKRRRPTNKLNADIGDLMAALPAVDAARSDNGELKVDSWAMVMDKDEGVSYGLRRARKGTASNKMTMKSLQHRPGALRRRKIAEGREMKRFRSNLAVMAGAHPDIPPMTDGANVRSARITNHHDSPGESKEIVSGSTCSERWAALRNFIAETLDKNAAFRPE